MFCPNNLQTNYSDPIIFSWENFWEQFYGTVYMSITLKLNANFCELKKEGHFHYNNFLRALKWVPTW